MEEKTLKTEIVGQISEHERNEAMTLIERMHALSELRLGKDNLNIDEIEKDLLLNQIKEKELQTNILMQNWWKEKYNKYKWKKVDGYVWEIDFQNCSIHLKENNNR